MDVSQHMVPAGCRLSFVPDDTGLRSGLRPTDCRRGEDMEEEVTAAINPGLGKTEGKEWLFIFGMDGTEWNGCCCH